MRSYCPIGQRSRSLRSCSQAEESGCSRTDPAGMTTRTWRIFEGKNKEHGGTRGIFSDLNNRSSGAN
jgi:hypothetical protein